MLSCSERLRAEGGSLAPSRKVGLVIKLAQHIYATKYSVLGFPASDEPPPALGRVQPRLSTRFGRAVSPAAGTGGCLAGLMMPASSPALASFRLAAHPAGDDQPTMPQGSRAALMKELQTASHPQELLTGRGLDTGVIL